MKWTVIAFVSIILFLTGCHHTYVPKPREYFRIDLPEKKYVVFKSDCPYEFEYPEYGILKKPGFSSAEPCWYNISIPKYKATIYLTYKDVNNDLATHTEDIRALVYKHIVKADDIEETLISDDSRKVYGIIYDLSGNTATSLSFFVTDSAKHFLSGSLYFSASPNKDSLAPVIQFFREDVVHLTETLKWK